MGAASREAAVVGRRAAGIAVALDADLADLWRVAQHLDHLLEQRKRHGQDRRVVMLELQVGEEGEVAVTDDALEWRKRRCVLRDEDRRQRFVGLFGRR